jgi:hypothetical protein
MNFLFSDFLIHFLTRPYLDAAVLRQGCSRIRILRAKRTSYHLTTSAALIRLRCLTLSLIHAASITRRYATR